MIYSMYMNRGIRYFCFIGILVLGIISPREGALVVHANVALDNAQADKARLESELSILEKEIAQKQKELESQKGQSVSLSRDIAILTTQITKAQLDIKAKNLTIQKLGGEITKKTTKIKTLNTQIEIEKQSLAQLIRKDRELDDKTLIGVILSNETLSEAYGDVVAFSSIKEGIKDSVDEIKGIRTETETEKKSLEKKKDEEVDTKAELENAKRKVELNESEKKKLLSISKNKETEYQKVLAEKAKRRSEILAAIFNLIGGTEKINFETALAYANEAKKQTGIDPAFLLAILTQESNLGKNVGQCFLTDPTTGNGKGANTGSAQIRVMHPTRDAPVFLSITSKLGIDYTTTRVSCWITDYRYNSATKKKDLPFGWGGAMGPAQFIPSTWKMFEGRLRSLLGREANPWSPRDAFMASAMYLTDLGAVGASTSAQHRAACKYYGTGGSTCSYSNSVMKYKAGIQKNIDLLQN